jgi:2',3'-cyclic-nucleotide 2'-phosphodiesterase (5'-nucleotidase family)
LVNKLRGTETNVVLLDCGDFASDWGYGQEIAAEATLRAMNLMGYAAVALGPRDLSLGPESLAGLLKNVAFPVVTSNLVSVETGRPFGTDRAVFVRDGVRIGVVGVLPEDEAKKIAPVFLEKGLFRVLPMEEAVRKAVGEIRGKVDILILLSQGTYKETSRLVEKVSGIDLAVSAGLGKAVPGAPAPKTPVVTSPERGNELGFVRFKVRRGRATLLEKRMIGLGCYDPDIPEDEAVAFFFGSEFKIQMAKARQELFGRRERRDPKDSFIPWHPAPPAIPAPKLKKDEGTGSVPPGTGAVPREKP